MRIPDNFEFSHLLLKDNHWKEGYGQTSNSYQPGLTKIKTTFINDSKITLLQTPTPIRSAFWRCYQDGGK